MTRNDRRTKPVGTARRHPTADESVLIGGVGTKHGQVENTSVTGLPTIAEIATLQLDDSKKRLAR